MIAQRNFLRSVAGGFLFLCLVFTLCSAALRAEPVYVENYRKIFDAFGTLVHAHGGGVLKQGDYYYWFGENRHQTDSSFYAVSCYRSKDLKTWEFRNNVLTYLSDPDLNYAKIERPKVIYNATTGKYVLWGHKESGSDYAQARAAVASCDTIDGNYTYLGSFRPLGNMSRDCTLFVDDNGAAYFVSSANENLDLNIYRLTDDYLNVASLVTKVWTGSRREAPCLFKRNGYYFIISSGQSGWSPNQSQYGYATSIAGPWSSLFNLGDSTTYNTQPGYVLTVQGSGQTSYLYMGDRWAGAWGDIVVHSKYTWLPLEFPTNTSIQMTQYSGMVIDAQTGAISGPASTMVNELISSTNELIEVKGMS